VDVRVMLEVLTPGVEHAEETDLGAKMLWIGRNIQQCGATGVEQGVVDDFLVLQGQPRQLVGNRKHDVYVVDRQQFLTASGEPLVAGDVLQTGSGCSVRVIRWAEFDQSRFGDDTSLTSLSCLASDGICGIR
jgi:hypothetical protein